MGLLLRGQAPPAARLATPTNVDVTSSTAGQATVTWDAVSGATGYIVKHGANALGYTTDVVLGNVLTTNVTGLTVGAARHFCVLATSATDTSGYSANVSITTLAAPAALAATAQNKQQINLLWSRSPGATGYIVRRGTSTGVYSTTFTIGDRNTFEDTGLSSSTQYFYTVAAINADFTSANATEDDATTSANLVTVGALQVGATAGGERLRSVYPASSQNWTVCQWIKITTDRNTYSGSAAFEHGGHSDAYQELITDTDGTTHNVFHPSGNFSVKAMTVGVWYFFALVVGTSGAAKAYWGVEGGGALTEVTGTVDYTGTFDQFTWAATNFASVEYMIGAIALGRLWNAQLTAAELFTESKSATIVRTADAIDEWPFASAATRLVGSYAGNTLNESGFGSFSDAVGPTVG